MKTALEFAREAGNDDLFDAMQVAFLERMAELVRKDERENGQKWFDAVTAQYKQGILVEREACAKLVEENARECDGLVGLVLQANADAIRARTK